MNSCILSQMAKRDNCAKCELCGLEGELTKHHLVPQLKCKDKHKGDKHSSSNILWVCRSCHDQIHACFSESELRDLYSTREKLLESSEMKKYIEWKAKHPSFTGHSKMSNARKKKR